MAKRMAKAQRAERDFWLECAERADMGCIFLCLQVPRDQPAWKDRLNLFKPDPDTRAWWTAVPGREEKCHETGGVIPGAEYRVLAACFLAAMAESGDL